MYSSKSKTSTKQIRILLKPLFLLVVFASSFLSANYAFAEGPSNFSNSASSLSLVNGEYIPAKEEHHFQQVVSGKFDTNSLRLLSPHVKEDVSPSNFYAVQGVGQDKQKIHRLDSEQDSKIQQATLSGSGTEANPYQIQSIADLQTLRNDVSYYDKHFILMQNLSFTVADYEDTSTGWNPIGNLSHRFSGSFNGNSKTIYHLFSNRNADYTGLFGHSSGIISNVRLEGVAITGLYTVGGLVGYNSGTLTNSSVVGSVNGTNVVGGLVGRNRGIIMNSSASGDVSGNNYVGGLVGYNPSIGTIMNSSASGDVNGESYVGGLVGFNIGTLTDSSAAGAVNGSDFVGGSVGVNFGGSITHSSASGAVSGSVNVGGLVGDNRGSITHSSASGAVNGSSYVGGLVGDNYSGSITNSLAAGAVNGSSNVGGLTGFNSGSITNSLASGIVGGIYSVGSLVGYNTGDVKSSSSTGLVVLHGLPATIPFSGTGTKEDPFQVTMITHLQSLRNNLYYYDKHFILINDLTFTSSDYENSELGWKPISNLTFPFFGTFDGNSKAIYNLHISRSTIDYSGFFGFSYGNITNLRLQEVTISGNKYVGGLVGWNFGTLANSSASGAVNGIFSVGGLVGDNLGTVTNSSASGAVNGTYIVGGLVGNNTGTILNSSATGAVSGTESLGGLVGYNRGTIMNSSASGDVNGIYSIGGLVGQNADTITNSSASGNIRGLDFVGGLVGDNLGGTIMNSSASGDVNGIYSIGGLVGHNDGTITNSSASGNICGMNDVGGLVGRNSEGTITNSVFSGLVTCDAINPTISSPSDASYELSSSDFLLSWTVSDSSGSGVFVLFRNGSEISSGSWLSGSTISTNLADLAVGIHNFTIQVTDVNGNSVSDTVSVTIQSVTTATTSSTTSSPTSSTTSSPTNIPTSDPTITSISAPVGTLWVLLCISLSLIITPVFIRRRHKHLQ